MRERKFRSRISLDVRGYKSNVFRTLPSREELARLDSFTLGEAVTARLRVMTGEELRAFATATASRSDGYYKAELARSLQENPTDDGVLRDSLTAFFRENPRAIERCDPAFVSTVLSALPPSDGDVAIDDEQDRRPKPLLLGAGIALLLFGAGAALDRATTVLHPAAPATPSTIVVYVTPQPQQPAKRVAPPRRLPPAHARTATHQAPRIARYIAAAPPPATHHRAPAVPKKRRVTHHAPLPPVHHRPKHVAQRAAAPTPTPMTAENLAIDSTPKPRSWLQRQLDHLNPFKRRRRD